MSKISEVDRDFLIKAAHAGSGKAIGALDAETDRISAEVDLDSTTTEPVESQKESEEPAR